MNHASALLSAATSSAVDQGQAELRVGARSLRIRRKMGEGGFAFIYAVEDAATGQELCLKKMHLQTREVRALAQREVDLMRSLQHPNLVNALDAEVQPNVAYILMELCPGGHLLAKLQRLRAAGGCLSEAEIIKIVSDVARGVQHLHHQVCLRQQHPYLPRTGILTCVMRVVQLPAY
jgi:NIMA (never in mitosis gene a)-related kinase 1/4/5